MKALKTLWRVLWTFLVSNLVAFATAIVSQAVYLRFNGPIAGGFKEYVEAMGNVPTLIYCASFVLAMVLLWRKKSSSTPTR